MVSALLLSIALTRDQTPVCPATLALTSSTLPGANVLLPKPVEEPRNSMRATASVRLLLTPTKATYAVNDEISFDVQIENSGDVEISVDDALIQHWNLFINVKDSTGSDVEYSTRWRRIRRISPTSSSDFVVIAPGHFYGRRAAASVVMTNAGTYNITARFSPAASEEQVQQFEAWGYVGHDLTSDSVALSVKTRS